MSIRNLGFLLLAIQGAVALAQAPAQALAQTPAPTPAPTPGYYPGFCPPAGATVDPPIVLLDDLCNAPPANAYRLQEQVAPLSFRQKTSLFVQNKAFSPSAIFGAAFFAEIAQVRNDPKQWPKGFEGFGRRFGTRYAQGFTKSTAEFLFGFKEDPRSKPPAQTMVLRNGVWVKNPSIHDHRPANATFGPRLGRALLSVVWTHYDSGSDGVAFSRVGGAIASGLVGRLWTPDPRNAWAQVGVRTGTAFGGYAGSAIFNEFQPDITKLLSRITGQRKTPQP